MQISNLFEFGYKLNQLIRFFLVISSFRLGVATFKRFVFKVKSCGVNTQNETTVQGVTSEHFTVGLYKYAKQISEEVRKCFIGANIFQNKQK